MRHKTGFLFNWTAALGMGCLLAMSASAMVDNPTRSVPAGQHDKVIGTIQGRDGETMRVREDSSSVVVVDLTDATKVEMKHGLFHWNHKEMNVTSLVPGLRIEADGAGNDKGQLVAAKVIFDPAAYQTAKAINTRVTPLEGRTDQLETRAGSLENRAGELETKTGELSDQEKQTEQNVAQVKTSADQANQGVDSVNKKVDDLDNYQVKYSATVYFGFARANLTEQAKQDLAALVDKTKDMKGYMVEVAGFTDSTGKAALNEKLSENRADAVVHYLQEQGNVPLRRILAPAGLGESHTVADNTTPEGRRMNRRVEVKILVNPVLSSSDTSAMNQPPAAPTQ